jgi:hypothetical protein
MDREYGERLLATARSEATNVPGDLQAVLHSAYGAVIRGDFDAFGGLVTEDVELTIADSTLWMEPGGGATMLLLRREKPLPRWTGSSRKSRA